MTQIKDSRYYYPLILIICALLICGSIWLWADSYKQFGQRKEIKYLSCAFTFDEFFAAPGLASLDRCLKNLHPLYPPLNFFLLRLAVAVFGEAYASFLVVNIVAMLILVLAVYDIGVQFFSRRIGFGAAFLLICTPQIAVYSKLATHVFFMTAVTALVLDLLIRAAPYRSLRLSLLVGGALTIAFLTKLELVGYLIGPFIYLILVTIKPYLAVVRSEIRTRLWFWTIVLLGPWVVFAILGWPWRLSSIELVIAEIRSGIGWTTICHMVFLWLVLWLYTRILFRLVTRNPEPWASVATYLMQLTLLVTNRGPFNHFLRFFYNLLELENQQPLQSLLSTMWHGGRQVDLSVAAFILPSIGMTLFFVRRYPPLSINRFRINLRALVGIGFGLILGTAIVGGVFSCWYWRYFNPTYLSSDIANVTGVHFGYQLFYLFALIYFDLSPALALLLIAIARCDPKHRGVRFAAIWYLVPMILFSYVVLYDKEPYRLLPALAGVTLLIAAGLETYPRTIRRGAYLLTLLVGLFFHSYPFISSAIRIGKVPGLALLLGGPELMFGKFILDPPPPDSYLLDAIPRFLKQAGLSEKVLILMSDDILGDRYLSEWNIEYYQLMLRRQGLDPVFVLAPNSGGEALQAAADLIIKSQTPAENDLESMSTGIYQPVISGWNPQGELLCRLEPIDEKQFSAEHDAAGGLSSELIALEVQSRIIDCWTGGSLLVLIDRRLATTTFSLQELHDLIEYARTKGITLEVLIGIPETPAVLVTKVDALITAIDPNAQRLMAPYPAIPLKDYRLLELSGADLPTQERRQPRTLIPRRALQAAIKKSNYMATTTGAPKILLTRMTIQDNPHFLYDFYPVFQSPRIVEIWARQEIHENER